MGEGLGMGQRGAQSKGRLDEGPSEGSQSPGADSQTFVSDNTHPPSPGPHRDHDDVAQT